MHSETKKLEIKDLEISDSMELSSLQLQAIMGGGWLSDAWKKYVWNPIKESTGWSTPSVLTRLDDYVNDNGGWYRVIAAVSGYTDGGY